MLLIFLQDKFDYSEREAVSAITKLGKNYYESTHKSVASSNLISKMGNYKEYGSINVQDDSYIIEMGTYSREHDRASAISYMRSLLSRGFIFKVDALVEEDPDRVLDFVDQGITASICKKFR